MADQHRGQPLLVYLPAVLARRARALLESPEAPYRDLSELVTVALENHLTLVEHGAAPAGDAVEEPLVTHQDGDTTTENRTEVGTSSTDTPGHPGEELLGPVPDVPIATRPPERSDEPLFVLTNRLSPIALALRVLVHQVLRSGPPQVAQFLDAAGRQARIVGLKLRDADKKGNGEKRYIGWPVGPDLEKTLLRFRNSFLLQRGGSPGPVTQLGLAVVDRGVLHPTPDGVELARAPSPVLGEIDGLTLGVEQQQVLRRCLLAMRGEVHEMAIFLRRLDMQGGAATPQQLDDAVTQAHPEWSENRLVAHRAALVGRLRDVGVLEATGQEFPFRVAPEGVEFVKDVLRVSAGHGP